MTVFGLQQRRDMLGVIMFWAFDIRKLQEAAECDGMWQFRSYGSW